jgi:hypothetical protein
MSPADDKYMSPPNDDSPEDPAQKEREELLSYKYILGDLGIAILTAVARGAHAKDSIFMLSGVPMSCVLGRMPVLQNLKLVIILGDDEIHISKRGLEFLKCINECI